MTTSWWWIAASVLLRIASLILGLITGLVLPLFGLFMIVWLHVPAGSILVTVGPVMMLLGLATYGLWRGGARAWRRSAGQLQP
jgi:uncharacterized membrane protein